MDYVDHNGEVISGPYAFKTPFNHNTQAESAKGGQVNREPTKTQQHQAEEADINTIVRRFGVTGQLPQVPLPPSLEEFADIFDMQTALNVMAQAKASFMGLPADVRAAFNNDPAYFVSTVDTMLTDDDLARRDQNLTALRAMGLIVPKGPVADQTTLGDVLKAIKEQAPKGVSPAPPAPNGAL